MESISVWAVAADVRLEPYGVEISPALADLARTRCPRWADRIWTANAHRWRPPRRFAYVRTGLDYVPPGSAPEYVAHLMAEVVAPRGSSSVPTTRNAGADDLADAVRTWGYDVAAVSPGKVKRMEESVRARIGSGLPHPARFVISREWRERGLSIAAQPRDSATRRRRGRRRRPPPRLSAGDRDPPQLLQRLGEPVEGPREVLLADDQRG